MDDMLTRLGLGDLVPRIRNYWYDEIEDLDLNSERIMFTDVEPILFEEASKSCTLNVQNRTVNNAIIPPVKFIF